MTTPIHHPNASALDPVDRASEVIFGLLMAMSFIGSISIASEGAEEVRTLLIAALGCNIAWGLVDAVMFLVAMKTQKRRGRVLLVKLRASPEPAAGRALLADEMPGALATHLGEDGIEYLRQKLAAVPLPPTAPGLTGRDYRDALAVFLLVVLATFPLVVPFIVIEETRLALTWSRGVAVAMLFLSGAALARYSGGNTWLNGLTMGALGVALIAAILALGG